MTHTTIILSTSKTLGEEHSGMTIIVDAAATITLPLDSTYKFIEDDEFIIISNTTSDVNIVGENGVTFLGLFSATLSTKGSSVTIRKHGSNEYIMWDAS